MGKWAIMIVVLLVGIQMHSRADSVHSRGIGKELLNEVYQAGQDAGQLGAMKDAYTPP